MIEIIEARNKKDLLDFVKFPYILYSNDKNWVPPLIDEQKDWVLNRNTPLFKSNPSSFFIAKIRDKVVGRIAVVEDVVINKKKNKKFAYFTMIESVRCFAVFNSLLRTAERWAEKKALKTMQGPVSPTKGDDFRGTLVWGFNSRPVLMNTYNFSYYPLFFQNAGYKKHIDLYAYYYDLSNLDIDRKMKIVEYAKKKFRFKIDKFNVKAIEKEAEDIKVILDRAMPEWPDLIPPPYEEVLEMAYRLKKFAEPDLIYIARELNGNPIGFNVALPDYNYVFHKLKGEISIKNIMKLLYFKRKIKGARMFVMFVIPEFRKKGVSYGIYLNAMKKGIEKGYTYAEGSTIGEENLPMRRDAEKIGGIHYKTYRVFKKDLIYY